MIQLVEADDAVIVVGPDPNEVGEAVRAAAERGERACTLVGSPEDPALQAALDEMIEELFGLGDGNS